MKSKVRILLAALISLVTMTSLVSAQSLLPGFVDDIITGWEGASAIERITGFIRLGLTLAFGAVVLVSVVYSILAAFKFIQSQGDAGKVEEANKAIKAIFQGVAAMFVGIIGIVLIFFLFDVAVPDTNVVTVCTKCPGSSACEVCTRGSIESWNPPDELESIDYFGDDREIDCNPDVGAEGYTCPD